MADHAQAALGRKGAQALHGIRQEIGFAWGQRAEGSRHGGDGGGFVDVSDNADLDRAMRQPVSDRGLEFGEVERLVIGQLAEAEARIVVRQDPALGMAERAIGGGAIAQEVV